MSVRQAVRLVMKKVLRADIKHERARKSAGKLSHKGLDHEIDQRLRALDWNGKRDLVERATTLGMVLCGEQRVAAARFVAMPMPPGGKRLPTFREQRFQSTWFLCTYHHVNWVSAEHCPDLPADGEPLSAVTAWAKQYVPFLFVGTVVLPQSVGVAET